jgi:hypothetical protein
MRVIAAPGLCVRDPRTRQPIGPDGVEVGPHDLDFARMLADGDVVPLTAPAAAKPAQPAAATAPAANQGE